MIDAQFEVKLIECLSLLDDGETIEQVLERYPDEAERLRPLLETAAALPALRMEPAQAAQQASRRAFLNQAHRQSENRPRLRSWLPRRLAIGVGGFALALMFAGGAIGASSSALPDEPLYSVKRVVEDARLLVAAPGSQSVLAEQFKQRRRDEIASLLASRRSATVEFDGTITAIQANQWQIAGLPVSVGPTTAVAGSARIGARAHVQGRVADGQLTASRIEIEPGTEPAPTATAPPAATARPAATPSPAPTATRPPAPTAAPPTIAELSPAEIEFSGSVEQIASSWRISGTSVEVNGETEIRGAISIGDSVKVHALRFSDGRLVARRIEILDGGHDNGGGNSGGGNSGDSGTSSNNASDGSTSGSSDGGSGNSGDGSTSGSSDGGSGNSGDGSTSGSSDGGSSNSGDGSNSDSGGSGGDNRGADSTISNDSSTTDDSSHDQGGSDQGGDDKSHGGDDRKDTDGGNGGSADQSNK